MLGFLFVLWPCLTACGISVLQPGIEPGPWQWKHRILTTSPPGNSLMLGFITFQIQISSPLLVDSSHLFVHFVFFSITFPFPSNSLSIPPPPPFPTQIVSEILPKCVLWMELLTSIPERIACYMTALGSTLFIPLAWCFFASLIFWHLLQSYLFTYLISFIRLYAKE